MTYGNPSPSYFIVGFSHGDVTPGNGKNPDDVWAPDIVVAGDLNKQVDSNSRYVVLNSMSWNSGSDRFLLHRHHETESVEEEPDDSSSSSQRFAEAQPAGTDCFEGSRASVSDQDDISDVESHAQEGEAVVNVNNSLPAAVSHVDAEVSQQATQQAAQLPNGSQAGLPTGFDSYLKKRSSSAAVAYHRVAKMVDRIWHGTQDKVLGEADRYSTDFSVRKIFTLDNSLAGCTSSSDRRPVIRWIPA